MPVPNFASDFTWYQQPGTLKQISVGGLIDHANAGHIWGVDDANNIWRWRYGSPVGTPGSSDKFGGFNKVISGTSRPVISGTSP